MDLTPSSKSKNFLQRLRSFMQSHVYPQEHRYHEELASSEDRWAGLPMIEDLKQAARSEGLWNLFVPEEYGDLTDHGGMGFLDYAPLCEEMGRVLWSAEVFNCNAPDTGNMEVFMKYGNEAQKQAWLKPLLAGDIRSSYAMTEPQVASSDATNIQLSMTKDGDEWVLNGRKWFITNAMNARTKILIVMGKSDPDNPSRHLQQTQILVPRDTPGLEYVRPLTTYGYDDAPLGHAELNFNNVRVPLDNTLLGEGRGFEIAQGRLAPGRMHHCMRLIGTAQRALELACDRVENRSTFGRKISKHQSIREDISKSFSELEMARLLVLKTCHMIDNEGVQASIPLISACKTTVPLLVQNLIDRCIQMHGAGGLTTDFMLAEGFSYARWCRLADGPDEVHQMALGKMIIQRYAAS